MVRWLFALTLLLSPFATAAVQAGAWQLERSDVLTVTASDGHAYRVMAAWPEGEPPAAGWPVLWVLDGEDNFALVAMTARRLARAGARSDVMDGIVIGIDSGPLARRVLDYTPATPGQAIPPGAPAHGLATGGADAFLAFLDARVRPAIAARWRIDPARQILLGHSFGGLLALHALFSGKWQGNVIAISPSLWFGDGLLEREERVFAPGPGKRLVLIATGDERGPDSRSGAAAEMLTARLRQRGLDARYRTLPGFMHGTTMLAAMGDAVIAAFGRGRAP